MTFDEWWNDKAPRTETVQRALAEPGFMESHGGDWTRELCREAWNAASIAGARLQLAAAAANLYLVQWDGGSRYVEASTFGATIEIWREAMRAEWGDDWTPEDEPDSVARVDDQPVLRAEREKP